MLNKFRKGNQKGFTLIELLIVVAIIGILAAIAIPQFASYRQRAFNSAALSDVRNISTAQEALYSDTNGYGTLTSGGNLTAVANATAGAVALDGPLISATSASNGGALLNSSGAAPFALSNNVTVVGTATVVSNLGTSAVALTKHLNGGTTYGKDTDSTATYRNTVLVAASTKLATSDAIAATTVNTDDFSGVANWSGM